MKTGNKALLTLAVALLAGMAFTGFVLREEARKINLRDQFKNYHRVPVKPFHALVISGGNGYPVEIRGGKAAALKVLKSRIGFLEIEVIHDTLHVLFAVANRSTGPGTSPSPSGLIIEVPTLDYLSLEGTFNKIGGLTDDSLQVVVKGTAIAHFSEVRTHFLTVTGSQQATIAFTKSNRMNRLSLYLQNEASCWMNDLRFDEFKPVLEDSATIHFTSQSLLQVMNK